MYVARFRSLLVHLVLGKIFISEAFLDNRFGHGTRKHERRHNFFDYDFQNWQNESESGLLDYVYPDTNKSGQFQVYEVFWPPSTFNEQTENTPIHVKIPSDTEEPTEAADTPNINYDQDTYTTPRDTTLTDHDDTTTDNPDIKSLHPGTPIGPTTSDAPTTETTTSTTHSTQNETTTTELVMTFPQTESNTAWTTLPHTGGLDYGINLPPGFSFPQIGPTMFNVEETATIPTTTQETTPSALVKKALADVAEVGGGYLTAFLLQATRLVARKTPWAASRLFHALEAEVADLESANKFSDFGRSTAAAFGTTVQLMNKMPADVVQSQAATWHYQLMNHNRTMSAEVRALMSQAEALYLEEEGRRILGALDELERFPNGSASARDLARQVMDAVVVAPSKRMRGSLTQKQMVQKLEELVIKKFFEGVPFKQRRNAPILRTVFIRSSKHKRIYTPPSPLTDRTRSTASTERPKKYAVFSKNETIKKRFKYRLERYKGKRDPNAWRQWRSKYTTTTTTTERTTRVTRKWKSKYVYKKYVFKNLKRMKTTTRRDTDYEIFKLNDETIRNFKPKSFKTKTKENNVSTVGIKVNKFTKWISTRRYSTNKVWRQRMNSKVNMKKYSTHYRPISKRFRILRREEDIVSNERDTDFILRKEPANLEVSSFTDEEENKLRANLDDAFFHGINELSVRNRRMNEGQRKNIHDLSGSSDDEIILKSKIYRVLGFQNDSLSASKRRQRIKRK